MPGPIDPHQMCIDDTGTEWYAPSSYSYNNAYVTPQPSSTIEAQPWPCYTTAPMPDVPMYTLPYQQQQFVRPARLQMGIQDPGRPKSSPSTFGPSLDSGWPTTTGLGIQYDASTAEPTPPVTGAFPPTVFQTFPNEEQYRTSSTPELVQPQPRRVYANIQPSPQITPKAKRGREDEDQLESVSDFGSKRRKRASSVASADLSEDDRFLVQLKEYESLPWKDIANRFQTDKKKIVNVAALQMRYKRLREKFRKWEEQDVDALKLAYEYWEKNKWDIISAKMLDYGLDERWPPRHCARKWQDIEAQMAFSQVATTVSSPAEGPVHHFGFVPIQ